MQDKEQTPQFDQMLEDLLMEYPGAEKEVQALQAKMEEEPSEEPDMADEELDMGDEELDMEDEDLAMSDDEELDLEEDEEEY